MPSEARVRTPEGARFFKKPIGSIIVGDREIGAAHGILSPVRNRDKPTYYLRNLSVPEKQQGTGEGTRFMQQVTAEADHDGAVLETHAREELHPWYARFGFRPYGADEIGPILRRDPQPPPLAAVDHLDWKAQRDAVIHQMQDGYGPHGDERGIKEAWPLTGGNTAATVRQTLSNGMQTVEKAFGVKAVWAQGEGMSFHPEDVKAADREQLGAAVGAALGFQGATMRRDENRIAMPYYEGTIGYRHLELQTQASDHPDLAMAEYRARKTLMQRTDAVRMGILDVLTNNSDRHDGNWLVLRNGAVAGGLQPIDNGSSYFEVEGNMAQTRHFLGATGMQTEQGSNEIMDWGNRLHPDAAKELGVRLQALRAEFGSLGRADWYDAMMERFAKIEAGAHGDVVLP